MCKLVSFVQKVQVVKRSMDLYEQLLQETYTHTQNQNCLGRGNWLVSGHVPAVGRQYRAGLLQAGHRSAASAKDLVPGSPAAPRALRRQGVSSFPASKSFVLVLSSLSRKGALLTKGFSVSSLWLEAKFPLSQFSPTWVPSRSSKAQGVGLPRRKRSRHRYHRLWPAPLFAPFLSQYS